MIVLDIEATGTNPDKHSIVSIAALDFEHPDVSFNEECRMWEGAHIDPEGLRINGYTESEIKDSSKKTEEEIVKLFFTWVNEREERTIAGHNPSFDLGFLQAAANRYGINITLAHRSIDQHSLVYAHMIQRGMTPPVHNKHSAINSDFIMEYVGIPKEPKPHVALNGVTWEAEALARLLYNKPYLSQFKKYPIPWLK